MDYDLLVIGAGTAGTFAARRGVKLERAHRARRAGRIRRHLPRHGLNPEKGAGQHRRARLARPEGRRARDSRVQGHRAGLARRSSPGRTGSSPAGPRGRRRGSSTRASRVLRGPGPLRRARTRSIVGDKRRVTAKRIILAMGSAPARPPIEGVERRAHERSAPRSHHAARAARRHRRGRHRHGARLRARPRRVLASPSSSRATTCCPAADGEVRKALLELALRCGHPDPDRARASRGSRPDLHGRGRDRRPVHSGSRPTWSSSPPGGRPTRRGSGSSGPAWRSSAARCASTSSANPPARRTSTRRATSRGTHQHTPAAWYEGQLAADNALRGNRRAADFTVFPTATFTIPALAQVGLTEEAARQRRRTRRESGGRPSPTRPRRASARRPRGSSRPSSTSGTGRLLGVHILGPGAEDLIHVAAVAMRAGLTRDDLAGMHYVFPTLAGSVFDAMWP